jgi:hypothetical protein
LSRSRGPLPGTAGSVDPVTIAGHRTSVFLVGGDGATAFEPGDVLVRHRDSYAELPPGIVAARENAKSRIVAAGADSTEVVTSWNGTSMVALCGYHVSSVSDSGEARLRLETCRNDYATFVATVLGLDSHIESPAGGGTGGTLRHEFLGDPKVVYGRIRTPDPALANGVGVSLLAFTDDDKVILTRRRGSSMTRPGGRDVSVVEGIHSTHDRRPAGRLSVHNAAVRGCFEELGVDVSEDDIHLLAFGVDIEYYQWNFYGYVDLNCSAHEVLDHHSKRARDRWEGKLECVPTDPEYVLDRLRVDGAWDTAIVTAHYAFRRRHGINAAGRAAGVPATPVAGPGRPG